MRLCEHPDFGQAIGRAEEHFRGRGLRAAIIEKDHYVTEVLRAVARVGRNRVIFKGGTSLSKGWNLIARFSEDIDLFLDPLAFDPPLGTKAIDRELKRLRDAVATHPAPAPHAVGGSSLSRGRQPTRDPEALKSSCSI